MAIPSSSTATIDLRELRPPSTPPPRFSSDYPPRICIHHPAYESSSLVEIPAFDGGEDCPGLHYGTVILICGILTDNRFDGMLSDKPDGDPLRLGNDDLLPEGKYYFLIPWPDVGTLLENHGPYKYPVVPTFRDWVFPHNNLPPEWRLLSDTPPNLSSRSGTARSNVTQMVRDRDRGCCVSLWQDSMEIAHLIPEGEEDWFRKNHMSQYGPLLWRQDPKPVNNPRNLLSLQATIHRFFDTKGFVLTRKQGFWVSHFFNPSENLGPMYHNQKVRMPAEVHPNFILSRLAWSIFPLVRDFLNQGESRVVRVRAGDLEMTPVDLLQKYIAPSRSSSATKSQSESRSPQKRKRDGTEDEDEEFRNEASDSELNLELTTDESDYLWDHRGRKMRRDSLISPGYRDTILCYDGLQLREGSLCA